MDARRFKTLVIAAVVVLAGAIALSWLRNSKSTSETGKQVLPQLSGQLNSIEEIHIVKPGDVTSVTLQRDGNNGWKIQQRDGYPADMSRLRKFLIELGELEIVEEKTANPDNYAALGVEDIASGTAGGLGVKLLGAGKKSIANLIIGKSTGYNGNFVRLADAKQSLMTKPQLFVAAEPSGWLTTDILNIPSERVQEVRIANTSGGPYTITRATREQTDFTIAGLPKGKTPSSSTVGNPIANAMANLAMEDVHAAGAETWDDKVATAEYRLFDGTVITVYGRKVEAKFQLRFAVAFDEAQHAKFAKTAPAATPAPQSTNKPAADAAPALAPLPDTTGSAAARAEAEKLGAQLKGWVYDIPGYKYETMFRTTDDLIKKP